MADAAGNAYSGPAGPTDGDYSATLVQAAERTKNTVIITRPAGKNDPSSPDYQCESYKEQVEDVDLMRAVYGGTKTMRAEGAKFLPIHPMEHVKKYEARLKIAIAFNALRKTVEGLSGMIFRRDPTGSEDMDAKIAAQLEDIDLCGNKLAIFLQKVSDNALIDGHTWVHVESPSTVNVGTELEAEKLGIRPYWINVKKKQAINWRFAKRGGKPVLTLFAYCETAYVEDGAFGAEEKQRIRVMREGLLDLTTGKRGAVRGELWELQEIEEQGKPVKKWVRIQTYFLGIDVIPVFIVYSEQAGAYESRPPLLDLAYEQIEYYRVRSDRQKSMTFSSIAVPYCFGEKVCDDNGAPQIVWGADGMMLLNDPNASAGILESSGNGLNATKEELQEIRGLMAALGLQMLVKTPGTQPTTATSDILDKSESNAALATFATGLEDATNQGLIIHGMYLNTEKPGTIEINRDFHEQFIDPQMVTVLGEQVAAGRLSLDTMWAILVSGEFLPEDFDPKKERTLIEKDASSGLLTIGMPTGLDALGNPIDPQQQQGKPAQDGTQPQPQAQ